jgi:hypothetical protein
MQVLGAEAAFPRLGRRANLRCRLPRSRRGVGFRKRDLDGEELGAIHAAEGNKVPGIVDDGDILGNAHFGGSPAGGVYHLLRCVQIDTLLAQHVRAFRAAIVA